MIHCLLLSFNRSLLLFIFNRHEIIFSDFPSNSAIYLEYISLFLIEWVITNKIFEIFDIYVLVQQTSTSSLGNKPESIRFSDSRPFAAEFEPNSSASLASRVSRRIDSRLEIEMRRWHVANRPMQSRNLRNRYQLPFFRFFFVQINFQISILFK